MTNQEMRIVEAIKEIEGNTFTSYFLTKRHNAMFPHFRLDGKEIGLSLRKNLAAKGWVIPKPKEEGLTKSCTYIKGPRFHTPEPKSDCLPQEVNEAQIGTAIIYIIERQKEKINLLTQQHKDYVQYNTKLVADLRAECQRLQTKLSVIENKIHGKTLKLNEVARFTGGGM